MALRLSLRGSFPKQSVYYEIFRDVRKGAFPIFCKRSWSRGKTTLSGLTLRYVLLKHGGSQKKTGMHP